MSKQFYIANEKIYEKQCNKNRCCCPTIQYAKQNGIKTRVNFIPKKNIEKIGFYDIKDYDALVMQIKNGCAKCK